MSKSPLTTKADETPEFVQFWDAWRPYARKNDGRGEARDTFVKHIMSGADGADIADGAKWYLRCMTDRDKEYIPLASTWINRRAFEDFAELERARQARVIERQKEQSEKVVSIVQKPSEERIRQIIQAAKMGMKA